MKMISNVLRETLWGIEVLHEVDENCWHMKVNNILRNCLELKLKTSFKEMFGTELSYTLKQDKEHFTEEKHLLRETKHIYTSKELERSYRVLR